MLLNLLRSPPDRRRANAAGPWEKRRGLRIKLQGLRPPVTGRHAVRLAPTTSPGPGLPAGPGRYGIGINTHACRSLPAGGPRRRRAPPPHMHGAPSSAVADLGRPQPGAAAGQGPRNSETQVRSNQPERTGRPFTGRRLAPSRLSRRRAARGASLSPDRSLVCMMMAGEVSEASHSRRRRRPLAGATYLFVWIMGVAGATRDWAKCLPHPSLPGKEKW